jgi:hypothetical protein
LLLTLNEKERERKSNTHYHTAETGRVKEGALKPILAVRVTVAAAALLRLHKAAAPLLHLGGYDARQQVAAHTGGQRVGGCSLSLVVLLRDRLERAAALLYLVHK